jgi:hypothetical protein
VATASEHGTVVKVFRTHGGQLVQELRRGAQPASISCLAFRSDRQYLAVASSSPTVHIFRIQLEGESAAPADDDRDRMRYEAPGSAVSALASSVATNLPEVMNDVVKGFVNAARSTAVFRIPDVSAQGLLTLDLRARDSPLVGPKVAFAPGSRVLVLHFNGFMYDCRFDENHVGFQECQFLGASTWFASRPDFAMQPLEGPATAGGEGEDWQVL